MARFPTVEALADASPADVLRQWSGLGYNRRALNLQRAARVIVERHGGRVPDDLASLEALPGVGPYTARAVAAIAFGRPVGPVDTNVRRVLGRVVAGHGSARDPGAAIAPRDLQALADAIVHRRPSGRLDGRPDGHRRDALQADRGPTAPPARSSPSCRYAAKRVDVPARRPQRRRPAGRRRATDAAAPYETSNRWLRGRIMARLSAAPDDGWLTIEAPIGIAWAGGGGLGARGSFARRAWPRPTASAAGDCPSARRGRVEARRATIDQPTRRRSAVRWPSRDDPDHRRRACPCRCPRPIRP